MLEKYSVEKKKYVACSMGVNDVAVARFHLKMPRNYLDKGLPLVFVSPALVFSLLLGCSRSTR